MDEETAAPDSSDGATLAPVSTRGFGAFALDMLGSWRARARARRASRALLRAYRRSKSARPDLGGLARYREVVARQTGLDEAGVRVVLERAESSFASWPAERPIRFRDVVQYLVAGECLAAAPTAPGIRLRLAAIVAEEIPAEL